MTPAPAADRGLDGSSAGQGRALAAGILAWVVIMTALWPLATSFGDEVGYVGEARLVLSGRFKPQPADVGISLRGVHAPLVPRYPLLPSLFLAPLFAITPRAVFALGIASAVVICLLGARVLRSWGDDPTWALLLLAHPTIVIIARTALADVPFCAVMLGAWWALRRDRLWTAIPLLAVLCALKSTGSLIAFAIGAGELWRRLPALRRRERDAKRALAAIVMGGALGAALVAATNYLSTGGVWFAYDVKFLGVPFFWYTHFPHTAPAQLRTVLLLPPLLFLGAIPLWRAREYGPLLVVVGFGGLMCFYFFVDSGTTWLESFVMAPRLILPIVVYLLIGYAHLLAALARRRLGREGLVRAGLVAATAVIALAVSVRHQRWQRPMGQALDVAGRLAAAHGDAPLGVVLQTSKVGVLNRGPVRMVEAGAWDTPVVLCSDHSASYRERARDGVFSCEGPGYRVAYRGSDGFAVLVRGPEAGGGR